MRSLIMAVFATAAFALGANVALANPSPNGPGQPGAPLTTCGTAPGSFPVQPTGFGTSGFAHAGFVYAGSPGNPTGTGSVPSAPQAISQYDIACFQLTAH
jgi:hypothetical protein